MSARKPSNRVPLLRPDNTKDFIDRFNNLAKQSITNLKKEKEICQIFEMKDLSNKRK